jgi:hypothetical protein
MAVKLETTIRKYIGLSSDGKPTGVPVGSTFIEYDTKSLYKTYDGTNWVKLGSTYGGNIYETIVAMNTGGDIALSSLGCVITVTSAGNQSLALPAAATGLIGGYIEIAKLGAGQLAITTTNTIISESGSGTSFTCAEATKANVKFRCLSATVWEVVRASNIWTLA